MTKKKFIACLLIVAMMLTIMPTAVFAADLTLTIDGRAKDPAQSYVLNQGEYETFQKVTVNGGDYNTAGTYKLSGGTQFKLWTAGNQMKFQIQGSLKESVAVVTNNGTSSYTIGAYSGYASNSGKQDAGTCVETGAGSYDGGETVNLTFTPQSGQEIQSLAIYKGSSKELIYPDNGKQNKFGQDFTVSRTGTKVTVSFVAKAALDIYALTTNEQARYNLNVDTNYYCSSNVTGTDVVAGGTKAITITPNSEYYVSNITITDGSATQTILYNETSKTVNGKTYSVVRNLDGSVVLNVPAMNSNVSIFAEAERGIYTVKVSEASRVKSDQAGMNYLKHNDYFYVTYEPYNSEDIRTLYAKTANGTYTAEPGDAYFIIDGVYYPMYTDLNGDVKISLNNIQTNIEFSVNSRSSSSTNNSRYHDITLRTVGSCASYSYDDTVYNGDDMNVSFYTTSGSDIRGLRIVYGGEVYTAEVYNNNYVWVDGNRWYIREDYDGDVTLEMVDIRDDVIVTASTNDYYYDDDYWYDRDYYGDVRVYENEDSHSNITWSGSNPFDYGEDTTITVTSDYNYVISSVRFSQNGDSEVVYPFDNSFTLNGRTYDIDWTSNRDMDVYFDHLYNNLTVSAYTVRGDLEYYNGSSTSNKATYKLSKTEDTHANVYWTGNSTYNYGDSRTITVTADSNYVIDNVRFNMGGSNITIEPFDTSFSLAGYSYNVTWKSNREMSVAINHLTNDLRITANTERGSIDYPNGTAGSITVNPSNNSGYHPAYMVGYGNGYFGAEKNLTRAEAVALLSKALGVNASNPSGVYPYYYKDIPSNAWYKNVVNYAASCGYLDFLATKGSNFSPNAPITRAEYLALACKFQGIDVSRASTVVKYRDVDSNYWAIKYINYCTDRGWVSGDGTNTFSPNRAITRAEIATMTNNILGRNADYAKAAATGPSFNDVGINHWAFYEIFEASHGHYATVVNGVETWN